MFKNFKNNIRANYILLELVKYLVSLGVCVCVCVYIYIYNYIYIYAYVLWKPNISRCMISYSLWCTLFSALVTFLKILHFGSIHSGYLAVVSTLPV